MKVRAPATRLLGILLLGLGALALMVVCGSPNTFREGVWGSLGVAALVFGLYAFRGHAWASWGAILPALCVPLTSAMLGPMNMFRNGDSIILIVSCLLGLGAMWASISDLCKRKTVDGTTSAQSEVVPPDDTQKPPPA